MKCPYCEEALQRVDGLDFIYHCDNVFCEETKGMGGTKELWQGLIRTRRALDVAKSVLENISSFYKSLILANPVSDINWDVVAENFAKHSDESLEQITALEQKDKRCGGN